MTQSILDTLLALERSDDLDSLKRRVRDVVNPLGYDRILMFSSSTARDELLGGIYWAEGDWFDDGEAMDAETFVRDCPVTRHILETDHPFFWTKEQTRQGRRYRFVPVPQIAGLHGLQVPVFGHNGLVGAVCFGGETIDSTPRSRLTVSQVGVTAFFTARELIEASQNDHETPLTRRELEVLQWIASGKRIADVATTLGLSDRTVENHLRRIRQRLRVKTTAQAIGVALRSGSMKL